MDLWKIEQYAGQGYFIEYIDYENEFISLRENGETGVLDKHRTNFWYNLVKDMGDETIGLTISRNRGLCPKCKQHFVFDEVVLFGHTKKLKVIKLLVGKKITDTKTEPYLKFNIHIQKHVFKKMREDLEWFNCEFDELIFVWADFPGAEEMLSVKIYVPIKYISQVRLEL